MQICLVDDQCINVQDHSRPVNVYGYDPKVGLKHACTVHATVAYTESETGQVILLINQAIESKGLDHHLFCPM